VLSGGEKSRLILAKLLINPPNFLLLDEPTTHLDVDAVDALVKALSDYEGTIVFISHDIYFVRSIANTVFEVKNGGLRKFPGNFDYYLEKKDEAQISIETHRPKEKQSREDALKEAQKIKAKEAERLRREEEKRRKIHNSALREKINVLKKEREKLRLESYAKARALSNPHIYRDEDTAREYGRRMKEIEKLISEIDNEIKKLEGRILN
jgi:ATP-binding cassette subfamily F protein 3